MPDSRKAFSTSQLDSTGKREERRQADTHFHAIPGEALRFQPARYAAVPFSALLELVRNREHL